MIHKRKCKRCEKIFDMGVGDLCPECRGEDLTPPDEEKLFNSC